ncbi:hypothetical protein PHMEG_00028954 [Phytophthora megakarya]|uniref:Uncharacterized protein n=1 Tax=Phytophthora megakarya TaxID=4795 RepID=A0A225V4P5_9STRA|nr:hypothetical protein PHMEG_00028954 [Phytophthora megakarya]
MALAPVSWDAPPAYNGPDVHLVGVPASVAALRSGAKVFSGLGGLEVLLCFESLDSTDLHDLDTLMGGDIADCLPFLRPRVAPVSLAAEVSSIAGQRELAALLAESNGTLSSETLVVCDNFDNMRREWTAISEAARQAAERRADEHVLDVNALVDFLMENKPKINVMFNWMRLAALLHHFAEDTPISEVREAFPKTRQWRFGLRFFKFKTS